MRAPTNYNTNRLYEIRKSFIEKISAWETRIYYALMLFAGLILSKITFSDETLIKLAGYFKINEFWTLVTCYAISIFYSLG